MGRTAYNQLVVLDEFYESGTHVDAAIAWLDSEGKPMGTIYCEHIPGELEKFQAAGWPAEKADKNLDSGVAEVRSRLEIEAADARDRPGTKTAGIVRIPASAWRDRLLANLLNV